MVVFLLPLLLFSDIKILSFQGRARGEWKPLFAGEEKVAVEGGRDSPSVLCGASTASRLKRLPGALC